MVSAKINSDPDVSPYYKLIFIPDYKVSSAQIIIPSADISQHISTAGTEASGTSCMKFTMTGSMIIGTHDGANIEIAKEIGDDNLFFFGNKVDDVKRIRQEMQERRRAPIPDALIEAFEAILTDRFGDTSFMHEYVRNMMHNVDFYLYTYDFAAYVEAQDKVDRDYADYDNWVKRCIHSITHMGYFSSDRSIMEYAENIWNVKPLDVPDPKLTKDQHTVERFEDIKELEKTA
jgi:starch phosphorylase